MQAAMLLACTAACADEAREKSGTAANAALPMVTVTAQRDPVDKSYRKMLQGMDLFEKMHGMAPNASLRYKLLPRQPDTNMDRIVLEVVGDSFTTRVPLAPDRTFTLERDPKALDEDASVRPNRKAGSLTWRTEIRTPGMPPDTRRLGDLRLECHVGIEADLVSNRRPSVFGAIAAFLEKPGYCEAKKPEYLFFAERPLFGVTLVSGARREVLPVDDLYAGLGRDGISAADLPYCDCQVLLDRTYYLPLGDRSWPDDTLVEFEYMDDKNAGDAAVIGMSSKDDILAALGKATIIRFDSGFEVWAYQHKGETPAKNEFVVLFDPSGGVAKTRTRPVPPPRETRGN